MGVLLYSLVVNRMCILTLRVFVVVVVVLFSDLVLLQDKKFLNWVKVYAQDAKKFDKDFTAAFQKLEELGTSGLTPTEWA
jgi:catalase (peroxidase I)